jgi:feruloyl-CoA synthase
MITSFFDNPAKLAPPSVVRHALPDGAFTLSSTEALGEVTRCVGDWLEHWTRITPAAIFLSERDAEGAWVKLSYAQTRSKVGALAQALLDLDLPTDAPVVCLSDNSLDQALLMLATMHIGRPFAAISSAYSRMGNDLGKLRGILDAMAPGLVYAGDGEVYGPAIQNAGLRCPVVLSHHRATVDGAQSFAELLLTKETAAVTMAFDCIKPETTAKYLLTSGSTGKPKVVACTHLMLCANQQQILQTWRFLQDEKPIIVSWLPWSHTFGSNHNFNLVLCNGGTLYLDEGRPAPGLIEKSVRNLREIQPNLYFNVPSGFDALLPFLEQDASFAGNFFARLRGVFYAAAALPQATWDRLEQCARKTLGETIWFSSAWGSTETSPLVTNVHWQLDGPGCIGLPVPGSCIKFVPSIGKLEMRVKGPQVFSGYHNNPDETAKAFDEEGFYKIGDAGALLDESRPERGIMFNGRVTEDFKLTTGTWVSVGMLRISAIDALAPYAQDVVITGHDRDAVGLLIFPSPAAKSLVPADLVTHITTGLLRLRSQSGGSSSRSPTRALLLDEAPSLNEGEITDKGYINQLAVLSRRAAHVLMLHAMPVADNVILID